MFEDLGLDKSKNMRRSKTIIFRREANNLSSLDATNYYKNYEEDFS
jgi:hypothetical protein